MAYPSPSTIAPVPSAPTVKFSLADDTRRWTPGSAPSLAALTNAVHQLYALPGAAAFKLKYSDRDGDQVTLASESDVTEMLSQQLSPMRITVVLSGNTSTDAAAESMEVETPAEKRAAPEAMDSQPSAPPSPDTWTEEAVGEFVNYLAMHLALVDVDPVSAMEVVKLLDKSNGKIDEAGANRIVECLRHAATASPRVKSKLATVATNPASMFLPINVPEHAKALILRAVGDEAGTAAASEPPVHEGVTCDGCNASPIRGRRYKSLARSDFDVCSECYSKDDAEWSKDPFAAFYEPLPSMSNIFHMMNKMAGMHDFGGMPMGMGGCGRRGRCYPGMRQGGWCYTGASNQGAASPSSSSQQQQGNTTDNQNGKQPAP